MTVALQDGDEDSIEKFSKRTVKVIVLQFGEGDSNILRVLTL